MYKQYVRRSFTLAHISPSCLLFSAKKYRSKRRARKPLLSHTSQCNLGPAFPVFMSATAESVIISRPAYSVYILHPGSHSHKKENPITPPPHPPPPPPPPLFHHPPSLLPSTLTHQSPLILPLTNIFLLCSGIRSYRSPSPFSLKLPAFK